MRSLMVVHLLAACLGTDPIPAPDRPAVPRITASPTSAVVQPVIPAGAPVPLDVGKFLFLDVTNVASPVSFDFSTPGIVALLPDPPAGATVADHFPGIKQGESSPQWHKAPSKTAVPCLGVAEGKVTIAAWGVENGRAKKLAELTVQVGPRPPPDVKPDDPKPDDPKPGPVTSFRVILVYESGDTMTSAQNGVLYGKQVEDYLRTQTTPEGNVAGFRRYDKDTDASKDQPTMAALWAAVKPKITAVPCMVIERNGKADIIPFPADATAALATLTKYREGK